MLANKVACPYCQATLKSAKPIPAGMEITCPKCRTKFKVPGENNGAPLLASAAPAAAIRTAGKDTVSGSGTVESPFQPGQPPPPAFPASAAPSAIPVAATPWPEAKKGSALPWILGGGLGGLVILVLVIYFAFLRGSGGYTPGPGPDQDVEFKPLPKRPLIALSKDDQTKVEDAVAKGVAYLKRTQTKEGTWPLGGHTPHMAGVGGLTLLECGVPASDIHVQKAAAYVRQQALQENDTYGLAVYLLFLDRLNDPKDKNTIRKLAMRLVAGQQEGGGWHYGCTLLNPDEEKNLVDLLKDLGTTRWADYQKAKPGLIKDLPQRIAGLPVLRDPENHNPAAFRNPDNSNTQFAVLALWAAKRHYLPLDRSLHLVVRRFRNSQNPDGSWNYDANRNVSQLPTMTCAGLLGLAVGYGLNPPVPTPFKGPRDDEAIQKALKRVGAALGAPNNDPKKPTPMSEMYFLWSVERVGMLYHLAQIDGKEWYTWGMHMLVSNQRPEGFWVSANYPGQSPPLDTCFALLFLQRANLAEDLTDKLQAFGGGGGGGSETALHEGKD